MRTVLLFILLVAAAHAENAPDGRKVYVGKCARCHKLYDPAGYDDSKWNEWMDKMKHKARLSETDYARLREYLDSLRK